jgi:transcriptional regulator with XRE-family HTH domain
MAQVGANLRTVRKRANQSQEATAYAGNMHRTEVGLIERGKRMPRFDTLLKLAGALGVEPAEFFRGVHWVPDRAAKGGCFERTAPRSAERPPG